MSNVVEEVRLSLPHIELAAHLFGPEDGIRDVERSRGLGDVYKRQRLNRCFSSVAVSWGRSRGNMWPPGMLRDSPSGKRPTRLA